MKPIIATDSCYRQQLIRASDNDNLQLMVANSKEDFAARINQACDNAYPPVVSGRGRRAALRKRVEEAGVKLSGESVRKWLSAESIPSMDNVRFIAIALKVDADWLLTGRENNHSVAREPEATTYVIKPTTTAFSADEQRMIEGFRRADPKDRDHMLYLANRAIEDFDKRREQNN